MQYDPIKRTLGRFFSHPPFMKRILYSLLDMLLLRSWHVRRALRKISGILPRNASVLDAGSGFGQYSYRMGRMNSGWKIKALDINPDHIEECIKFIRSTDLKERIFFEQADLTELKDNGLYDLILSVDVMEHISEDEKVFLNFFNALKPGGYLIISTPSDKGGSDVHSEGESSFIEEHVRDGYGIEDITGKLTDAGFINIKISFTYGIPGSISWRISMKYPIKMLEISKLSFLILPLYFLLFFPVAVILNIFDLYIIHKTGTGLLVTANK
jgi:SAM-dependent methyltransferase